ncbi:hypothetical protein [Flavobacterium tyrosinilyticum]
MNTKNFLPVWYGGGIGNNRNALCSVGHLSYAGFIIPKCKIMSTNTLSKETELRLTEFFNNSIDSKSMAKTIRQVNFLIALNAIREDGFMKTETVNIEDGFFWLNELAEILDPYLGIE